jgi:ABC-type glycerol-3-phosphate transport system permease component
MIGLRTRTYLALVGAALATGVALVALAWPPLAWLADAEKNTAFEASPDALWAVALGAGALLPAVPAGHALARRELGAGALILLVALVALAASPVAFSVVWQALFTFMTVRSPALPARLAAGGLALSAAIWLCREAFAEVPRAAEDAARLDGLGAARVLVFVALPLAARRLVAALVAAVFVAHAALGTLAPSAAEVPLTSLVAALGAGALALPAVARLLGGRRT